MSRSLHATRRSAAAAGKPKLEMSSRLSAIGPTATESPVRHQEQTITAALESSIDGNTMAGLTDGRFSHMLQRGSALAAPAIAPRNRYAGSIAEESSSISGGALIAVNTLRRQDSVSVRSLLDTE